MKTFWNALSFIAVINLMALVLFVGWLWQSDRLDRDRIHELREILAMTVHESEQQRQAEEDEQVVRAIEAERSSVREDPPLPSEATIQRISSIREAEWRVNRRLDDERRLLHSQIDAALADIRQRERELEKKREAWEESRRTERERKEDEQFAKAVRQYESVRPRTAKNMMMELINAGDIAQAVAYLDAMNDRAASKILEEFRTDEEVRLAKDLLERLRTFGLDAAGSVESDNAKPTDADPQPERNRN